MRSSRNRRFVAPLVALSLARCVAPADRRPTSEIEEARDDLGLTPCCVAAFDRQRVSDRAHGDAGPCLEGYAAWCYDPGRGDGLCSIECARNDAEREESRAERDFHAAWDLPPPAPAPPGVAAAARDALRAAGMRAPLLWVPHIESLRRGFSTAWTTEPETWFCHGVARIRGVPVRRFDAVDPVTRTVAYACCEVGSETCTVLWPAHPCTEDGRDCIAPFPSMEQL